MCKACINIIIDKEDPRLWDEQKQDWALSGEKDIQYKYRYLEDGIIKESDEEPNFIEDINDFMYDKKECHCICGHVIKNKFIVYNDNRRVAYVLGSVCIHHYDKTKNGKDNDGIFNGNDTIELQFDKMNRYTCKFCNKEIKKDRKDKHNLTERHKKNELIYNFRKCDRCQLYTIPKIKPLNYNYCTDCFKIRNAEYLQRLNRRYKVNQS